MRKSKQETAATRVRIIKAAAAEFRRDGIAGVGLNDFMAAAGLTHGGFYRHFSSKDQLVKEALTAALDEQLTGLLQAKTETRADDALAAAVGVYLSPSQRDDPANSCPLAMLGSELARCNEDTRRVVTDGFLRLAAIFAERQAGSPTPDTQLHGMVAVATMIGALMMSRVMTDTKLSDVLLAATKKAVLAG